MDYKGIDLNLLVAFNALMQERNVSRAAVRIGVSQPAMSAALSRLRALLSDHLFTRTANGLLPTQKARDLAEPVSQALTHIDAAFFEKSQFEASKATFTFSIGISDHPLITLLPGFVKALSQSAPDVKLKVLTFSDRDDAVDMLDAGKIDAAIGVLSENIDRRIQTKEIFTDRFVTVMSKENPSAKKQLNLKQFLALSHILVSPEGDEYGIVDRKLAQMNEKRKIVMTLPNMFAATNVVVESNYISTILKRVALASSNRDQLIFYPPPVMLENVSFHLIWHIRNESHSAQVWMRNLITQVGGSL